MQNTAHAEAALARLALAAWRARSILFLCCACMLFGRPARGHGEAHEMIAALTRQIDSGPPDARLYVQRGSLHGRHGDWEAAAADFDRAAAIDPALSYVDLARGEILAQAHRFEEAKAALTRFIAKEPENAAGFSARGRALFRSGEFEAAAADFAKAITLAREGDPLLYLERSAALVAAKRPPDALTALDEAITRFGSLVTLQQPAIELELAAGNAAGALSRIDALLAVSPRKERWLTRRGEILLQSGRRDAAREAYTGAREAIDLLPVQRRNTAATRQLTAIIDEALASLTNSEEKG